MTAPAAFRPAPGGPASRGTAAPPPGVTCHQPPWDRAASAAALLALASWTTPDLPLYGNDHDRGDFAP